MTFWKFWQEKKTNFPNIYHADFVDKVEPADDDNGKQFTVQGVLVFVPAASGCLTSSCLLEMMT
jgi:hypothetical protein